MLNITKHLTKLGDSLGLVRDNKIKTQTDGLTHLYSGLQLQIIISVVVAMASKSLYSVMLANWIFVVIFMVILIASEHFQELAMVKKDPNRKYGFSKNRHQDYLIYFVFGVVMSGLVTLVYFLTANNLKIVL